MKAELCIVTKTILHNTYNAQKVISRTDVCPAPLMGKPAAIRYLHTQIVSPAVIFQWAARVQTRVGRLRYRRQCVNHITLSPITIMRQTPGLKRWPTQYRNGRLWGFLQAPPNAYRQVAVSYGRSAQTAVIQCVTKANLNTRHAPGICW